MPTLEDTIDFPVTTLSDLLEADARAGVPLAAGEDRYRRWAFLSTGSAGVLAVILVVVLLTGGGDGNGKGKTVAKPPGTVSVAFPVSGPLSSEIEEGAIASVLNEDGMVIASGGKVLRITEGKGPFAQKTIEIAVQEDEARAVETARASKASLSVVGGKRDKPTPATGAPAAGTPAPAEPAPVPVAPTPPPT